MAFTGNTGEILGRLERAVNEKLEEGWVSEPDAARLALLIREELGHWTRATYPGSACDVSSIAPDSRRHLGLTIHSAPVTHRVEIWGLACGDEREREVPSSGHEAHSWVVLAHLGDACPNYDQSVARLTAVGLKELDKRTSGRLKLGLWMGATAPDGCPACQASK